MEGKRAPIGGEDESAYVKLNIDEVVIESLTEEKEKAILRKHRKNV